MSAEKENEELLLLISDRDKKIIELKRQLDAAGNIIETLKETIVRSDIDRYH